MSETPDQARTRRRWITLAELVAVAGVIIAGLGFWNSWSERRDAQVERAQEACEAAKKSSFVLKGTVDSDHRSVMLKRDDDHSLGDVHVTFPAALGVPDRDALSHTIDSAWFAEPILKLTDGGPDKRVGRLPILLDYSYVDVDGEHHGRGIYDVIWDTSGRFLLGRRLAITDFRLRQQGGTKAALDRMWKAP